MGGRGGKGGGVREGREGRDARESEDDEGYVILAIHAYLVVKGMVWRKTDWSTDVREMV